MPGRDRRRDDTVSTAGRPAAGRLPLLEFCLVFCTVSGCGQSSLWSLTVHWILLSYAPRLEAAAGAGRGEPWGEPAALPGLQVGAPPGRGPGQGPLSLVCLSSRRVHSVFVLRAGREAAGESRDSGVHPGLAPRWQDWSRAGLPGSSCSDSPSTGVFMAISHRGKRPMTHRPPRKLRERLLPWPQRPPPSGAHGCPELSLLLLLGPAPPRGPPGTETARASPGCC